MQPLNEVILDTSILGQGLGHVDLEGEIQRLAPGAKLGVLSSEIEEINRLPNASVVKQFVEKKCKIHASEGFADKAIKEYAIKNKVIVATQDKALKQKLQHEGIKVIFIRNKDKLEME